MVSSLMRESGILLQKRADLSGIADGSQPSSVLNDAVQMRSSVGGGWIRNICNKRHPVK